MVVVREWARELSRFDVSQFHMTFAGILGRAKLPFGWGCETRRSQSRSYGGAKMNTKERNCLKGTETQRSGAQRKRRRPDELVRTSGSSEARNTHVPKLAGYTSQSTSVTECGDFVTVGRNHHEPHDCSHDAILHQFPRFPRGTPTLDQADC